MYPTNTLGYIVLCYNKFTEKAMAPHSSTLAWKIPWMEEPGKLQSVGLQRLRHDWATSLHSNLLSSCFSRCPAAERVFRAAPRLPPNLGVDFQPFLKENVCSLWSVPSQNPGYCRLSKEPQEDPTTLWTEPVKKRLLPTFSLKCHRSFWWHISSFECCFYCGERNGDRIKTDAKRANHLSLTVLLFICMGLFTFQKLFLFAFHVVVGILDKGKFFKMKNKITTTSHPVIHTRWPDSVLSDCSMHACNPLPWSIQISPQPWT